MACEAQPRTLVELAELICELQRQAVVTVITRAFESNDVCSRTWVVADGAAKEFSGLAICGRWGIHLHSLAVLKQQSCL